MGERPGSDIKKKSTMILYGWSGANPESCKAQAQSVPDCVGRIIFQCEAKTKCY